MKLSVSTAMVVAVVGVLLIVGHSCGRGSDPGVTAAVSRLREDSRAAANVVTPSVSRADRSAESAGAVHPDVLTYARSLSSFFPTEPVVDLSGEQLAALERVLTAARRSTYALLIERSTTNRLPDGSLRITIPAQGTDLVELRAYVYDAVERIVGSDRMASLQSSLGPKFDAKFAYFGQYDLVIDLVVDHPERPPNSSDYITMRSHYRGVNLLGFNTGKIMSTNVLKIGDFEATVVPLGRLKPGG